MRYCCDVLVSFLFGGQQTARRGALEAGVRMGIKEEKKEKEQLETKAATAAVHSTGQCVSRVSPQLE